MTITPFAAASEDVQGLWRAGWALVQAVVGAARWITDHLVLLGLIGAVLLAVGQAVQVWLAAAASRRRVRYRLTPSRRFEADAEQIWRYAVLLTRAASSGPWWAPRRSRSVRIELRADGGSPLDYIVEGPASARQLLASTPYRGVTVMPVRRPPASRSRHTVRAEFVVRGPVSERLREVPLEPDPLQPLVDAVATLRTDLGDRAEICIDLQAVGRWNLLIRRWQVLADARARAQRQARRDALTALEVEDSWRQQLAELLGGRGSGRRPVLSARPRPVDRTKALGRLAESAGLVRIQILVRCSSDRIGRAHKRLGHIAAALDIYAAGARIVRRGRRIGPWRFGDVDSRPWRRGFDARWATGQITGTRRSWVRVEEIAGLFKPVTRHCRLPLLVGDLPIYRPGDAHVMPHGWHIGPDGVERLIATPLAETLFSVRVGKTTYGKTAQALVQMVALAHGGHGALFVDPHGDSFREAAPYLAHRRIAERLLYLDLTGRHGDRARLGTWNPLGLERGQRPEEVVRAVVDAFATVLGWNDVTHPRAMTVLTKGVEALVAVNAVAVAAGRPKCQATLFQLRTLLTNPGWRNLVLAALGEERARWWTSVFPQFPADALAPVLNPLDRLAASPVARSFLGSPTSTYDIRAAMDHQMLVWICPSASGPTDRLLVSLLFQDLFRAGISRRDTPANRRPDFHTFVDELISIDSASSGILAAVSEELRKFGIRLHAMTQLLQRVSVQTRESLMQNASVLSSTAGASDAAALMAKEWGGAVDSAEIAELPRFHHYITLTVGGRRLGPLLIRGPQVSEVFDKFARPSQVGRLHAAVVHNLAARPVAELEAVAAAQDACVADFLRTTRRTSLAKPGVDVFGRTETPGRAEGPAEGGDPDGNTPQTPDIY
ncbi:ATP/GTP-binding protein [Streptomyces megasporus]|uniref:ATP/GTP-binding protein n=1 Tax=Streptomyces megasporus TaxID=44060 RepID=UPI000AC67D0E|nr:ATP/GTP-binding protein [Streptomyces megasporus]